MLNHTFSFCLNKEKDMYYASRLAKMIQCKTVSKKDEFEEGLTDTLVTC